MRTRSSSGDPGILWHGKLALKVIRARLCFIRRPGADFAVGDRLLEPGVRIGPGELGLIAAANLEAAEVVREPRVTICTAGDELVMPGSTLRQGQSVDSASHAIAGLIRRWGGVRSFIRSCRTTSKSSLLPCLRPWKLAISWSASAVRPLVDATSCDPRPLRAARNFCSRALPCSQASPAGTRGQPSAL